jgi:hypothetical protein
MSVLGVKGKGSWYELENGSWSWNKGASCEHEQESLEKEQKSSWHKAQQESKK